MIHAALLIFATLVVAGAILIILTIIWHIANTISGEETATVLVIALLLIIPFLSWKRYEYVKQSKLECQQHIIATPSVYDSDSLINTGFAECDHIWSFWNWSNNS